jgi:uncharacterized protein YigE (DUF2233 family)
MKKIIIIFLSFLIVVVLIFKIVNSSSSLHFSSSSAPTPTIVDTSHQLSLNGQTYRYYYYLIPKNSQLKLIPNFSASFAASKIIQGKCDFAINGGLYTEEAKPVGLFYLNGQSLGQQITHQTFNGFLTQNKKNILNISSQDDFDNDLTQYNFALQSGPFYNFQNSYTSTDFVNHEFSRRHLIVEDNQNNFYFFSISLTENAFSGPRLEDIPVFFTSSEIQKIAQFTNALNLDGGAASAFYDGTYLVQELTPVGSILCGTLNP